jgi:methionyl-tRNA formyltransferase
MRLVFAGTPQTAVPSLNALLGSRHEVAAVITRPDAAAGRGRQIGPSPVAQRADEAGVPVLKPVTPREPGFIDRLREIAPDCCPVTAYGALIPKAMLAVPRHGWVNLHFSLLPAWRGAAPVPHAIWHGDDITGATTFSLVPELDAGPVYGVLTEVIRPTDTTGDLLARLAESGAELLVRTLDGIEDGQLSAVPQPVDGVSLAPKLTPEDARVRWNAPAHAVDRQIRACTPAPGAWTMLGDARLKLWPVRAAPATTPVPGSQPPSPGGAQAVPPAAATLAPGELLVTKAGVFAGTATQPVELGDVQQGGKRRMKATDWARGLHQAPAGQRNGTAGQHQPTGPALVLS